MTPPQEHIAMQTLRSVRKIIPDFYRYIHLIRQAHPAPYPVFLDFITYLGSMMRPALKMNPKLDTMQYQAMLSRLITVEVWGLTKGVYRFDPELFDVVWDSEGLEHIPVSVFDRMPEWTLFVETPGKSIYNFQSGVVPIDGFFMGIQNNDTFRMLSFVVLYGGDLAKTGLQIDIPLRPTFKEAIQCALENRNIPESLEEEYVRGYASITGLINLVIYICSQLDDRAPTPPLPEARKVKGGQKLFAATDRPRVWDVGIRTGPALRKAHEDFVREYEKNTGRTCRPHFRRGHMRGVWHGPRNDKSKQTLELKWIMPTLVNAHLKDGDLPAVVRRVQGDEAQSARQVDVQPDQATQLPQGANP